MAIAHNAPPGLRLVLNHLGAPPFSGEAGSNSTVMHEWYTQIRALGKLQNV